MSDKIGGYLLVGLMIALPLAKLIHLYFKSKYRAAEREKYAGSRGFVYKVKPAGSLLKELSRTPIFANTRGWKVYNYMAGPFSGQQVQLFDCWLRGQHREAQRKYQTVALLEFPGCTIPKFHMQPENMATRLFNKVGVTDVDFESAPRFSERWFLYTEDEEGVREFFHQDLLSHLANVNDLCMAGQGNMIAIYRENQMVGVEKLDSILKEAVGIAEAVRRG